MRADEAQVASWKAWADRAKRSFVLPSEDQLAAARTRILAARDQLLTELADMPDGGGIAEQIHLAELPALLESQPTTPAKLDAVYHSMCRRFPDRVHQPIDRLRTEIYQFTGMVELVHQPRAEEEFSRHVDLLAAHLAAPPEQLTDEVEQTLRDSYAWLHRSGQIDTLLAEARSSLSHPNQVLRVRQSYLDQVAKREIKQPVDINRTMNGTRISGQGEVAARPRILLVPNANQGEVQLVVQGDGDTSITARRSPATIRANAHTQFSGRQSILATGRGFEAAAAVVEVSNCTALNSVCLSFRSKLLRKLATPIARRMASQQLAQTDRQTVPQLKQQVTERLQEEVAVVMVQINDLMNRLFLQTLETRDVNPNLRSWSTSHELDWTGQYATPGQLGALAPPPRLDRPLPAMEVQFHQSAFNHSSSALAGKRLDEALLYEQVFDRFRLLVDGDTPPEGRIIAAITFADQAPLDIRFVEQRVELTLRIAGFEYEGGVHRVPVQTVRAVYQPQLGAEGVSVERLGPVDIQPGAGPATAELAAVLDRLLVPRARTAPRIEANTELIPQAPAASLPVQVQPLRVGHARIERGWLSVGLIPVEAAP